jgi:hypothetical protein
MIRGNIKDISGMVFNRLKVVEYSYSINKKAVWRCICSCGNIHFAKSAHLLNGHIQSCGCLKHETTTNRLTTHGLTNTRLHRIWTGMLSRCRNPKTINYKYYGGKGVSVCRSWSKNFMSFYLWAVKNGYSDRLTIDRIDTKNGYLPSNCRWITIQENARRGTSNRGFRKAVRNGVNINNAT